MILKIIGFFALVYLAVEYMPLILEDILSFAKRLDKDISETVLWPKMHDRGIRYRPFMKFNNTKYKMTLKNKLNDT